MQIAPPLRFCHIGTKSRVLLPSKYAKIRCQLGTPPGELTTLPQTTSRLGRGHRSPYRTPLGTNPPSALAMRPPEFQPDLRICLWPFLRVVVPLNLHHKAFHCHEADPWPIETVCLFEP